MQIIDSLFIIYANVITFSLHPFSHKKQHHRVTKQETLNGEISMSKKHWTKIYEKTHTPSFVGYKELDLSASPVMLRPGQVKGIYIHSTRRGDEAIVYDNKEKQKTHDDSFITIMPGRAHVSEKVRVSMLCLYCIDLQYIYLASLCNVAHLMSDALCCMSLKRCLGRFQFGDGKLCCYTEYALRSFSDHLITP